MRGRPVRKHYIDNLRSLTILLLFPVHTFMIWNDFGSGFYIWAGGDRLLSTLIVLVNPWFMPLLFVLAGMSARYALERRAVKEFIIQRLQKLLIPFVFGMIFLVPFQTLYARKYFDHYEGGIWDNLGYFFTHLTDFSGYDGGFTPGHLWFILFLFLISMAALLLFKVLPRQKVSDQIQKTPFLLLLFLFVPVWGGYYLGNFGGYSLGKNLVLFLIGYYFMSDDHVMETLEKNLKWLLILWIVGTAALGALYYNFAYYGDLWVNLIGWISILFLLAAGKRFLNRQTKLTAYFSRASYPVYLLHQSILVALAYYVVQAVEITAVQALLICVGSFALTVFAYHLVAKIPILRKMVGIK